MLHEPLPLRSSSQELEHQAVIQTERVRIFIEIFEFFFTLTVPEDVLTMNFCMEEGFS